MCRSIMARVIQLLWGVVGAVGLVACEFPRPADVMADGDVVGDAAAVDAIEVDAGNADATEIDAVVPHAPYLEPRYLPDICDAVATATDFTVTGSASFDTQLANNCTGGVVGQDSGPEICVVRYGAIKIVHDATLVVVGTRALAFVADSAVTIEGVLDVSASGITAGPGGGTVISGGNASGATGGGGAGYRTPGGAGGSVTDDGGGAAGGGAATDPSIVTVLLGGSRPRTLVTAGPIAGGGGGAATLIACRGAVSVTGTIDAGGGGGTGGGHAGLTVTATAGAGGGSGGTVVLQGLTITVTGQVFANGGGGGAGTTMPTQDGRAGADGTRSATDAALGGGAVSGAGSGGAGGYQATTPRVGLHPTAAGATPGGGGGSMGFFQTYTPMGVTPTLAPTAASPTFSVNKVIKTR
jgi:hypothetical protein